MPQVAQQDFILVESEYANSALSDVGAHLKIFGCYKKGTLFDCLIKNPTADDRGVSRIIGVFDDEAYFYIMLATTRTGVEWCAIENNEDWLFGLYEIQHVSQMRENIPSPTTRTVDGKELFFEGVEQNFLCVNDKYVIIEVGEDEDLVGYEITNITPEQGVKYVNISEKAIERLYGYALY